jgi:hypothetical protein
MRRPNRTQFPPPSFRDHDEFGLPVLSLLGEACETPEERTKRVRRVRRATFHFYRRIVEHLGEEEAAKLMASFGRRREGREPGSTNPRRDRELLAYYWASFEKAGSEAERAALPRKVAEEVFQAHGVRLGNSADAIEKRLRRLLSKGSRERAIDAKRVLEVARRRPLTEPWPDGDTNSGS